MDYTMKRDKNLIYFQPEGKTKAYKFDVNSGTFYGLTGQPIKSCPTGFDNWIKNNRDTNNIIFVMCCVRSRPQDYNLGWAAPTMDRLLEVATLFNVADKLGSIGYSFNSTDECSKDTLVNLNKYFKDFAKYIRENPDGSIREFEICHEKNLWRNKHKLVADGHLTNEIIDLMWKYRSRYNEKNTSLVAYYISRGLYDFYDVEPQSIRFSDSCASNEMFNKIREYFTLCEELNVEPQKEDFFRSYINLRRTYMMNKKELDMAALIAQYEKHPALAYENDLFKVVIPTTRDDFLSEANTQQNCVYSYYLPKVIEGKTNVVFIRRKNAPNKSYITCEVSNRGVINQYLGFANQSPTDADAIAFREEYTDYLRKNW